MNKEEFKALYSRWKEYKDVEGLENSKFICSLLDSWLFNLLFINKIKTYFKIRKENSDKIMTFEEREKLLEYLKQENP